jgi:hypothetical protein
MPIEEAQLVHQALGRLCTVISGIMVLTVAVCPSGELWSLRRII